MPAKLEFNEQGTPVSRDFEDIYFSNDSGIEETRHVFLAGNQLAARFAESQESQFTVAESGFGTGLNFLTLWQAFTEHRQRAPDSPLQRLHFISFEKFPLLRDDLIRAHAVWPELAPFAQALQAQWPVALPGCQRLILDQGHVTLDLWFGDINQVMDHLDESLNQRVDAWFLDGFSPAKNPDMWTDKLFAMMARLARPGGSFATFTAAGFVRRGLQQAGFEVKRIKGFGPKREMLVGVLAKPIANSTQTPWYHRRSTEQRDVAIVGGGIASALLALNLLRRGFHVTLYCQDKQPALGASGNRQGALYPLLNAHDPALEQFFPSAFTFARRLYDTLAADVDHDWCGVTQLAWDEKSTNKIKQMIELGLPQSIATPLSIEAVTVACGVPTGCAGINYPLGGWIYPAELTRQALALAEQLGLQLRFGHQVNHLIRQENGWTLTVNTGESHSHGAVVLANGQHINQFSQTAELPVYAVGGQVSHIPTTPALSQLKQVLCYDGYLTPASPRNHSHCIGASYHRGQRESQYSEADQWQNKARLAHCLPEAEWVADIDVSGQQARNGVRCATRDHLPMVGNVPDYAATLSQYQALADHPEAASDAPVYPDLFMLGALGARGLCSAPLAAEILASQMSGEPLPLDRETLAALSPNRFWVRKLLKGREITRLQHT